MSVCVCVLCCVKRKIIKRRKATKRKKKMSQRQEHLDWEQQLHNQCFDETLTYLTQRKAKDPSFTYDQAKTVLEALYTTSGTQWDRGTIVEIKDAAKIAAYEVFLEKWDDELAAKTAAKSSQN